MQLPIERVVIHRDGARVLRCGTVTADSGVVTVEALPLLLHEPSMQVTSRDTAITSVSVELDVRGLDRTPRPEQLAALDELLRTLSRTETEMDALEAQIEALSKLAPGEPDVQMPMPTAAQLLGWADADDTLATWRRTASERRAVLDTEAATLREKLEVLRTALAQDSGEPAWRHWLPTRRAVVRIEATGPVSLSMAYRVPGALWTPAYALHVDPGHRTGRLVLRALVAQSTGEDWSQVPLALSTAPLTRRVDAPVLASRRLSRRQPEQSTAWRPLPTDLDGLFPSDLTAGAVPRERAGQERVTALEAPWSDDNVAALDTAVPRAPRRARLAPPTPPPALEREMQAAPLRAPMAFADEPPSMSKKRPAQGGAPQGIPTAGRVAPTALDYRALRMNPWDAPPGQRGRLSRVSVSDQALSDGLSAAAVSQMEQARWRLERMANDLSRLPLPPHHQLPDGQRGADFVYETAGPCDIPADGAWHSVSLTTEALDLSIAYRAIPREDPRVFRNLTATMTSALPLLAGPVDVFVAGRLELTTPWRGSGQDSPIELGLGPEDGIRLARNARYREEATGMFGGGRRIHTDVELTLASSLSRAITVEVFDRMPVADDDTVSVSLESAEPTAAPWPGDGTETPLKGGLRQQVHIPPGGEARATLHWHMSVGARYEVDGGERRGD